MTSTVQAHAGDVLADAETVISRRFLRPAERMDDRVGGSSASRRQGLAGMILGLAAGLATASGPVLRSTTRRFVDGWENEEDLLSFGRVHWRGPPLVRHLWLHNLDDRSDEPVEVRVRLVGCEPSTAGPSAWPTSETTAVPRLSVHPPVVRAPMPGTGVRICLELEVSREATPGQYTWIIAGSGFLEDVIVTTKVVGGRRDEMEDGTGEVEASTPVIESAIARRAAAYRAIVRTEMARFLPRLEPEAYLSHLVQDYPNRPGKLLRSSLCLATCEAFGGPRDDALAVAIAVELMHNAFLVHDDIEDESALRRGKPTLHAVHGVPLSLNAGDALAMAALRPLQLAVRDVGPLLGGRLWDEFSAMTSRVVQGQAIELGWQRDGLVDVSPADYLEMTALKTASYTTVFPMCAGALIATGGAIDTSALISAGVLLGCAFQIVDDVSSVRLRTTNGKDHLGDLYEGKRSLPVLLLHRASSADERRRLEAFLRKPRLERESHTATMIAERLVASGALDASLDSARALATEGLAALESALVGCGPSPARTFLLGLCRDLAWPRDEARAPRHHPGPPPELFEVASA